MSNVTDHELRLLAARVLDEKDTPYNHVFTYVFAGFGTKIYECEKCHKRVQHEIGDNMDEWITSVCSIPDLPTEPLEVLAFRCRDKVAPYKFALALMGVHNAPMHAIIGESTPAHWIQAASRARGIE